MINDYYLQNRTFTKDRDIECANEMVVGRDILPQDRFLYEDADHIQNGINLNSTETEKTLPNGDVIVNSGVILKLEATNSIQFKPGFHAKSGSQLLAQVDGTNPSLRSAGQNDYTPCGRIEKSVNNTYSISSPTSSSVNWHLKGLNLDLWQSGETFTVPDKIKKGQYSLSAETVECRISSILIEAYGQVKPKTEIESLTTKKKSKPSFKIVPNPARESIKLVASQEIDAVTITSAKGQSMASLNSTVKPINVLDISSYSPGVYQISITYKNGEIETEQLVVQR